MAFIPPGRVLTGNSSIQTLAGSGVYIGSWEDVSGFANVAIRVVAAGTGTYNVEFSEDASTIDSNVAYAYDHANTTLGNLQIYDVLAKYFRIVFTDISGVSNAIRVQCIGGPPKELKVSLNRQIPADNPATIIRQLPSWYDITVGNFKGKTVINKFGHNPATGTGLAPICTAGVYQTPTTATALEIVSSSANDTAAGSGARTVTLTGLNSSWSEVTQTVSMNGVTPVAIPTSLIRLYKVEVATSGTYGTSAAGSMAGTITVRVSGAGATWATIGLTPFPICRTEIGAYTIPLGYVGYIFIRSISTDTTKTTNALMYYRERANITSAPYGPIIEKRNFFGLKAPLLFNEGTPIGPLTGPCDVMFMAQIDSGTADVAVEFDIIQILS